MRLHVKLVQVIAATALSSRSHATNCNVVLFKNVDMASSCYKLFNFLACILGGFFRGTAFIANAAFWSPLNPNCTFMLFVENVTKRSAQT